MIAPGILDVPALTEGAGRCPPSIRARIEADIGEETRTARIRSIFAHHERAKRPGHAKAVLPPGPAILKRDLTFLR